MVDETSIELAPNIRATLAEISSIISQSIFRPSRPCLQTDVLPAKMLYVARMAAAQHRVWGPVTATGMYRLLSPVS